MIRQIIFDMGQVLIQWRPEVLAASAGTPEADIPLLCKAVFDTVEWVQLDRGVIAKEDALSAMLRELPERLHGCAAALVRGWWNCALLPVPGMEALAAELKGKGYGIYLLSNATSELHSYFPRIPGSQYFDGKIVSADWKFLKPQHEIYETLFREFGLRPEECFFIDDVLANIEGARNVGMSGAVFDGDISRLRRKLREAGVEAGA